MMMTNPRRGNNQSIENQSHSFVSSVRNFLKKPQAFPFLLSLFLFLTWASLRFQHSSPLPPHPHKPHPRTSSKLDDAIANLARFSPSILSHDNRGWILDPIALAQSSGISGGALSCASVHIGEIRPGSIRGNHRHYTCNETFVIWGATTKFRLEKREGDKKGYAEVILGADEVGVAASPSGTAHALVNMDPLHSTFFMGCQDNTITYNNSSSDFNVWNDL